MTSDLNITGNDNKIILIKDGQEVPYESVKGLSIIVNGNSNTVKIELPSRFINTSIIMNGDNNYFSIKPTRHRYIRHTSFGMENGGIIEIGGGFSVYRNLNMVAKSGKKITIGDECMFAREVIVRNNDGHTITDTITGEILNAPEDIKLHDKVWVGARTMILKGTEIQTGSIVGAMSLVNKKFSEPNLLIAGVPANKIRGNVAWDRADFDNYVNKDI